MAGGLDRLTGVCSCVWRSVAAGIVWTRRPLTAKVQARVSRANFPDNFGRGADGAAKTCDATNKFLTFQWFSYEYLISRHIPAVRRPHAVATFTSHSSRFEFGASALHQSENGLDLTCEQ